MRGIHIEEKEKIKISKGIIKYIKPQIIYIPLENKQGVVYKHLVKEGDYVYKGDVVAINEQLDFPLHSSVSGYVIKGVLKQTSTGKMIRCIALENDFKERFRNKTGSKRDISKYSKDEFLNMLKNSGITGLGGSDFPSYIKYTYSNLNTLIVNGVECEPYVSCDKVIMEEYIEELLEGIDAVCEIMNFDKAVIALKETDYKIINQFLKYIGSYPKIKIHTVTDIYPNGWERYVVKELTGKTYDKYPVELGIVVNNVSTIYAIYELLKYNRPLTERIITFTGNGLSKPCNVKVKIGASVSEILNYIEGYKNKNNLVFCAGGPMMGISLKSDDMVITRDVNCIYVNTNYEYETHPCINCSKCVNICPVNLMPIVILKNLKNKDELKKLKPSKCIECGLCSYICPSKIELSKSVKMAKEVDKNA